MEKCEPHIYVSLTVQEKSLYICVYINVCVWFVCFEGIKCTSCLNKNEVQKEGMFKKRSAGVQSC